MKKLFTLLLVALLATTVGLANNVYVKVTSEDQLFDSQKTYILVSVSQSTNATSGAITNYVNVAANFTSTFSRKNISYKEGSTPGNYISNNLDAIDISSTSYTGACELRLNGSMTQCTIALPESYNDATTGETNYIAWNSGNNMKKVTDAATEGAQWRLENDGNGYVVYNNKDTERLIAQTSYSSAFACVKESTTNKFKAYLYVQAGESTLEASPTELDLGQNPSGIFTISGENLLKDITVSTSSTGFSVEPNSFTISNHAINNGEITVFYSGTSANASGKITIRSGNTTLQYNVTAQAQAGTLDVSTETLDLGTNPSGTFVLNGSYLTNTSSKRVQLKATGSGFSVSPSSIIPVNNSIDNQTITVSYNGVSTAATGTITITATDAYGTLTKTVTVTAQAQEGTLEVSTETLDLGMNPSGTFTVSGQRLINATIAIDKSNSDNDFSISPTRLPLSSNALNNKEITVSYKGVKANATAYIIITATDAYGTTLTKTVTVTAQAQSGTLEVSTETLNLGSNPSGTFTVSGTNLASHATVTIDKENSDNGFSLSKSDLSPSLHALNNEEVVVSYRGAKENASAQVIVTTTDAYGTLTKTVTVTAQALLEVSTNSVALGTNPSGTFSVSAKNLGQNITISLVENSDGKFDASPETITVSDGVVENQEITVTYTGRLFEATATIHVTSGEITRVITVTASAGEIAATGTVIYIDKTDLPADARIWAYDSKGNYYDTWPGKLISELETVTIGKGVEVYQFVYSHEDATSAGVVFNQGGDNNKTDEIAPNNHEIFYYTGNADYRLGVPIDEVIFPDEYFRFALGTYPRTEFDTNNDGVLHPDEIAEATSLKFGTDYFSPLRNEYAEYGLSEPGSPSDFTGIGYLYALTEVDLSGDVRNGVTPCPINSSYIDLSKNINLVSVRVSAAPDLKILTLPATETLKELNVGDQGEGIRRVSMIDVSKNPNLEILSIINSSSKPGRITMLDLSQNEKLKSLTVYNEPITPIDLQVNTALEVLTLGNTAIETLDLTPLTQLKELSLSYNKQFAQDLVLSNQSELTRIYVREQEYPEKIDLTANTKLQGIYINQCSQLNSFTIPELPELIDIEISSCPQLKNHTIDLTASKAAQTITIVNLGEGQANTLKGVCKDMTQLKYLVTDYNHYEGDVLDLEGCQDLHTLSVINCNLCKLNIKGCTSIGTKVGNNDGALTIYSNYLRALDLEDIDLKYNYNLTKNYPSLFSRDTYINHDSYNGQITPEMTPNVALVYHDRWAETPNYTYLVYVRLEQNPNDCYPSDYEADPSLASEPVLTLNGLFNKEAASRGSDVDNVGFDYQRVKLWSRFATTKEGPVLDNVHGTTEIHALTGVDSPNWDENTTTDLSHVDPTHVLGKILSLGMYTVPCGHDRRYHETTGAEGTTAYVEPAYVGGTVSYLYSTLEEWEKEAEVTDGPSPMPQRDGGTGEDLDVYAPYNGAAITSETDYYKGITVQNNAVVEKYNNAIPFKFDWKVELTNDPESIVTAIKGIHGDLPALIEEIQYYNVMGQMSHKPFEGVNIVVTRYSDGTTTTQKVIR